MVRIEHQCSSVNRLHSKKANGQASVFQDSPSRCDIYSYQHYRFTHLIGVLGFNVSFGQHFSL